jgi:hypothetical protein
MDSDHTEKYHLRYIFWVPCARLDSQSCILNRTLAQGFVAGWIATVFNAPFDVAKSRAQSAAGGAGGRGPIQVLGDIIRTEGPGGIYKVSVGFMV